MSNPASARHRAARLWRPPAAVGAADLAFARIRRACILSIHMHTSLSISNHFSPRLSHGRAGLRRPSRGALARALPTQTPAGSPAIVRQDRRRRLRRHDDQPAKAARDELGRDIDCMLLGVAKRTTPSEPGEHEPGGTVLLSGEGSRMAHLLCAKVDGDTWLCHRGSFLDGALNTSVPLSEHDLAGV